MAAEPLPDRPFPAAGAAAGVGSGAHPRRTDRVRGGRDRRVGSIAAKVVRPCQRNDCPAPARAGVELNHGDKVAILVDLPDERDPRRMELCADHAGTMSVPLGWTRLDERKADETLPPQGPPSVTEITSRSTLEVLTAALEFEEDDGSGDDGVAGVAALPVAGDAPASREAAVDDGPTTAAVMAAVLAHGRPDDHDVVERGDFDAGSDLGGVDQPADDDQAADDDQGDQAVLDGREAEADAGFEADAGSGVDEVDGVDQLADTDVLEEATDIGTQLVLAEADRMARRARPVPAATDD